MSQQTQAVDLQLLSCHQPHLAGNVPYIRSISLTAGLKTSRLPQKLHLHGKRSQCVRRHGKTVSLLIETEHQSS